MADRSHNVAAVYGTAVGLLALGTALHYGWALVPAQHAAQVWNICGAVARAALLIAVVVQIKHPLVWSVGIWWLAEETMVAGCSALFIVHPWHVPAGQAQCSSLFAFDFGIPGALTIMTLVLCATGMVYRLLDD